MRSNELSYRLQEEKQLVMTLKDIVKKLNKEITNTNSEKDRLRDEFIKSEKTKEQLKDKIIKLSKET
jgi:hypothetical protein